MSNSRAQALPTRLPRAATARDRRPRDGRTTNTSAAALEQPPFYAVRIFARNLGSFADMRTARHARVVDVAVGAVPGLHAAGNDMVSIFGGNHSGAGINIGQAMTFGCIAANHAAGAQPAATPA